MEHGEWRIKANVMDRIVRGGMECKLGRVEELIQVDIHERLSLE